MPRKYMKRKPMYRRRRYARKGVVSKNNRTGGKVVALKNSLVPDRLITKFIYRDNINLSASGAQSWQLKTFRLNSIYDPDLDVTNGHQPLGYDQWNIFYNRYRVFKAVVRIEIINNGTTGVQCALVPYNFEGVLPSPGGDAFYEQPHAITKVVAGSSGINRVVLKKVIDIPRLLGKSHEQYRTAQQVASTFGNNPIEQVYGVVGVRTINDSAAPTVVAIATITYYTELYDRLPQSISYPEGKDPTYDFNPSYSPSFQIDPNSGLNA